MNTGLKVLLFRACKQLGLFHLSRWLMRRRLLILCFHGIAKQDEASFRPMLFMPREQFERRLSLLADHGFPVVPLPEALDRLQQGKLAPNSVAITIDDGFSSTLTHMAPALEAHGFPATLYLTTYYVENQFPIFRLAVQYMLWKTQLARLDVSDCGWGISTPVDLSDESAKDLATWEIIRYGEAECDEQGRQQVCRILARRLGIDYDALVESRILGLLSPDELPEVQRKGIDLQLHTHRHHLPVGDRSACQREIRDNRDYLQSILGEAKSHLCYPSGIWNREHWDCLQAEGIESAATSRRGLNTATTPRLSLCRIIDHSKMSDIEFEAELFGFCELIRILTGQRKLLEEAGELRDHRQS